MIKCIIETVVKFKAIKLIRFHWKLIAIVKKLYYY